MDWEKYQEQIDYLCQEYAKAYPKMADFDDLKAYIWETLNDIPEPCVENATGYIFTAIKNKLKDWSYSKENHLSWGNKFKDFSLEEMRGKIGPVNFHRWQEFFQYTTDDLSELWDLERVISTLKPREQKLINLRLEGYNQEDTGAVLGVSRSMICKMESKIYDTIKRRLGSGYRSLD